MDLKFETIPCFVLHTLNLIYLIHNTYTFLWIWNLKILQVSSSTHFIWYTYLTMLIFFHGFEIWNYYKFGPPHFSFDISISQSLYFFMDLKFENIPSFVLHPFPFIYLAQDSSTFSSFCHPWYLFFFSWIWNIPSFVLDTFHLIHLSHNTYTIFKDWIFENYPSLVFGNFQLIYLAKDRGKVSVFCPPRYFYFFLGFEI